MGAKQLKTTLLFGGKLDSSLDRALKASKSKAASASRGMSGQLSSAMNGALRSVMGTALKVFAVVKSIGKLKDFATEAMAANQEQIAAETKLETLLRNVNSITIRGPDAVKEAANRLKDVATKIQSIGVIGDEVTLSGMQQLATFQLSDDTIASLSSGMADLLAQQKGLNATQDDAVSVANMIGKAMSGQTGALSKVGIIMDENQKKILKTGTEQEKAAAMADILAQNVGGVNKALAQTDDGKIKQMSNTMGDMKETIGSHITPLWSAFISNIFPYVQSGFSWISNKMDEWQPILESLINDGFSKLDNAISYAKDLVNDLSGPFSELKDAAGEIVSNLRQFFPSVSEFQGAIPGILTTMINIATKVLEVTDAFMDWNGFIPTLVTIGTLIGIIKFEQMISGLHKAYTAYRLLTTAKVLDKIETLQIYGLLAKDAAIKAFNTAKTIAYTVACSAMTIATQLWSSVCQIATIVTQGLGAAFTFLTSPIGLVIIAIMAVIAIVVLLVTHWNQVKAVAANVVNFVSLKFQAMRASVSAAIQGLQAKFGAVFAVIRGAASVFVSFVTSKISGIRLAFTAIQVALVTFSGKWKSVFNTIRTVVNNVISAIKSKIESVTSVFSGISSKISGLFDKIGNLKSKASSVKIPGYSEGTTVTAPTLAYVGEGKVPETIVPHNDSPRSKALLATAAKGVGMSLGTRGGNTYVFSPVIYGVGENLRETIEEQYEKFKSFIKQYEDEQEREEFA